MKNENSRARERVESALSISGIVDPMWNENSEEGLDDRLTILEEHYLRSRGASALMNLFELALDHQSNDAEIAAYVLSVLYDKKQLNLNKIRCCSLSLASDIFSVLQMDALSPEQPILNLYFRETLHNSVECVLEVSPD